MILLERGTYSEAATNEIFPLQITSKETVEADLATGAGARNVTIDGATPSLGAEVIKLSGTLMNVTVTDSVGHDSNLIQVNGNGGNPTIGGCTLQGFSGASTNCVALNVTTGPTLSLQMPGDDISLCQNGIVASTSGPGITVSLTGCQIHGNTNDGIWSQASSGSLTWILGGQGCTGGGSDGTGNDIYCNGAYGIQNSNVTQPINVVNNEFMADPPSTPAVSPTLPYDLNGCPPLFVEGCNTAVSQACVPNILSGTCFVAKGATTSVASPRLDPVDSTPSARTEGVGCGAGGDGGPTLLLGALGLLLVGSRRKRG